MSILRLMVLLLPSAAPRALVEEVIVDGMVHSVEFARNAPPAELESLAERFAATHGLGHEARDQLISRFADTRAREASAAAARAASPGFRASQDVLLFTRVSKTGSWAMLLLLRALATRNRFTLLEAPPELWNIDPTSEFLGKTIGTSIVLPEGTRASFANEAARAASALADLAVAAVTASVDANRTAVDAPTPAVLIHGLISTDVYGSHLIEQVAAPGARIARVAIVRDPAARALSAHAHVGRERCNGTDAASNNDEEDGITCEQFRMPDACFAAPVCRARLAHLCQWQVRALCPRDARACANAGGARDAVAVEWLRATYGFIGRTENLEASVGALEDRYPRFFAGARGLWQASAPQWGATHRQLASADDVARRRRALVDGSEFLAGTCARERLLYEAVERAFPLPNAA